MNSATVIMLERMHVELQKAQHNPFNRIKFQQLMTTLARWDADEKLIITPENSSLHVEHIGYLKQRHALISKTRFVITDPNRPTSKMYQHISEARKKLAADEDAFSGSSA